VLAFSVFASTGRCLSTKTNDDISLHGNVDPVLDSRTVGF